MNERQLIDHWGGSRLVPQLTNPSPDVDSPTGYFTVFGRNMTQFRRAVRNIVLATNGGVEMTHPLEY